MQKINKILRGVRGERLQETSQCNEIHLINFPHGLALSELRQARMFTY